MKPDDEPTIVSLESHRRRRQADSRKKAAQVRKAPARARSSHERAINWRRAPLALAILVLFLLAVWLIRQAGGLLNPFS